MELTVSRDEQLLEQKRQRDLLSRDIYVYTFDQKSSFEKYFWSSPDEAKRIFCNALASIHLLCPQQKRWETKVLQLVCSHCFDDTFFSRFMIDRGLFQQYVRSNPVIQSVMDDYHLQNGFQVHCLDEKSVYLVLHYIYANVDLQFRSIKSWNSIQHPARYFLSTYFHKYHQVIDGTSYSREWILYRTLNFVRMIHNDVHIRSNVLKMCSHVFAVDVYSCLTHIISCTDVEQRLYTLYESIRDLKIPPKYRPDEPDEMKGKKAKLFSCYVRSLMLLNTYDDPSILWKNTVLHEVDDAEINENLMNVMNVILQDQRLARHSPLAIMCTGIVSRDEGTFERGVISSNSNDVDCFILHLFEVVERAIKKSSGITMETMESAEHVQEFRRRILRLKDIWREFSNAKHDRSTEQQIGMNETCGMMRRMYFT